MVKVYLDWNVMSGMKNNKLPELDVLIADSKKFLLPFSTAHIGDIYSSYDESLEQKRRIEQDLEYISTLSNNLCIYVDGGIKDVLTQHYDPKDLFEQRIDSGNLLAINPFENILQNLSDDETLEKEAKNALDRFNNISLEGLIDLHDENSSAQLESLLPGFREDQTMKGMMNAVISLFNNLNEKEDYAALRKMLQSVSDVNRDAMYHIADPFAVIADKQPAHTAEPSKSKNAPDWYNDIINNYITLDMYGYQEDRVNTRKGRKETFKNTTEDSFHAAFASTCNFYITNDKKTYNKTKQVYQKLGIDTIVLKPEEFVEYYNEFFHPDKIYNLLYPIQLMLSDSTEPEITEDGFLKDYRLHHFFFDFFNRITWKQYRDQSPPLFILRRMTPVNFRFTFVFEIITLVELFLNLFGNDRDNLGTATIEEFNENGTWTGRFWEMDAFTLRLIMLNHYVQLYYDFKIQTDLPDKPATENE